jgi:hypothetical protein
MANAGLDGMMAFAQAGGKGDSIDTVLASLEVSRKQIYFGVTADPAIQPPGATFTGTVLVNLTCATAGADIHYTLDGTRPTKDAVKYIPGEFNNRRALANQPTNQPTRLTRLMRERERETTDLPRFADSKQVSKAPPATSRPSLAILCGCDYLSHRV